MAITIDGQIYRNLQEQVLYLTDKINKALANIPEIVQTTGDSETAVMSQKATTAEINALKNDITELQTALIGVSNLIGGDA